MWAPGDKIVLPGVGNDNGSFSGTSFATPLVAGAMALWREANPTASVDEIEIKEVAKNHNGNLYLDLTNKP